MSDGFICDTPQTISAFQFRAQLGALKLETLGMKRRGRSAYAIVKEMYGYKGSKAKVLETMQSDWDKIQAGDTPSFG
jgi:hypothetical protein